MEKFTPEMLLLLMVTEELMGEKVSPVLLGVTVYVPFVKPVKL